MRDLLYVVLTVGFFGTMLADVRACRKLGQRKEPGPMSAEWPIAGITAGVILGYLLYSLLRNVTRQLREWSSTPIIVLSARGREQDKVAALDLGATTISPSLSG